MLELELPLEASVLIDKRILPIEEFEQEEGNKEDTFDLFSDFQGDRLDTSLEEIGAIRSKVEKVIEVVSKKLNLLIDPADVDELEKIGEGGTSIVYLAEYKYTQVALKKLKSSGMDEKHFKEFNRELTSLTMLRHPNLILFMGTMSILK